ncbi:MAG: phosphate ABC transporter permease [Deltaproteobacteria bacterium]|nr:phosphate ABC transporter permease [Deltaproteobacteria bacterium]
MNSSIRNVVARRDLLAALIASDLRASTAGSRLGWVWWFLDPVLLMLVYWGIVAGVFGRGSDRYEPYPLFLFVALATWKHFAASVTKSIGVLRSRDRLIKAIPFPTIALPIAVVASGFVYFLAAFGVFVLAAALWPSTRHSGALLPLLQAPALMVLQLAITAGVCMAVACYGVVVPDLRMIASHLLRVGFYLSPGLYGVDLVRERVAAGMPAPWAGLVTTAYMANPFAILFTGYRDAVLHGAWIAPAHWLALAAEAGVALLVGYRIYQHHDRRVFKFL